MRGQRLHTILSTFHPSLHAPVGGIVGAVWVSLYGLARLTGGSLAGGARRMLTLGIWTLTTAQVRAARDGVLEAAIPPNLHRPQVLSQAASLQSPSATPIVRRLYGALANLQLHGVLSPPSCTGA